MTSCFKPLNLPTECICERDVILRTKLVIFLAFSEG